MTTSSPAPDQQRLLAAARGGDEQAFGRLVEPHRGELQAHCYRMLGSVHDAEDALQDASLRAWRGLGRFEGRSSLRSWLYTVATNTCLTEIERRPRRGLPVDFTAATDPRVGPGEPVTESVWLEPFADQSVDLPDGLASPEARYEQRESVELAFVAALQLLPASQRAVLILREVLGFSAQEVADTLDTSVAAVNSALQRARKTIEERTPERSQQATLRELGDEDLKALVEAYADAWERLDVDAVVGMLTEDATIAMPPLASWFGPRDQMAEFLALFPMSGRWRWKSIPTRANAQPALGFYMWDEDAQAHLPFALNVLGIRGRKVSDVTAFAVRVMPTQDRETYAGWGDQPADPGRVVTAFTRFGLPERLP